MTCTWMTTTCSIHTAPGGVLLTTSQQELWWVCVAEDGAASMARRMLWGSSAVASMAHTDQGIAVLVRVGWIRWVVVGCSRVLKCRAGVVWHTACCALHVYVCMYVFVASNDQHDAALLGHDPAAMLIFMTHRCSRWSGRRSMPTSLLCSTRRSWAASLKTCLDHRGWRLPRLSVLHQPANMLGAHVLHVV